MIRIGVDVGGTNTDAVIMDGGDFVAGSKRLTTPDIISGVRNALAATMEEASGKVSDIGALMVGTTHFVNALVRRRDLAPTGVIRICLPSGSSIPPFSDWPSDLIYGLDGHYRLIHGGYEMDGREIAALNKDELLQAVTDLRAEGITEIALSSVFSTVRSDMEQQAFDMITEAFPDQSVTKSTDIGRLGLLERENAAIINGALRPLAAEVVESFLALAEELDLQCPLYFTKNDGTLISADQVSRLPVLTFACGPTNSMRGAAFLSGIKNGLVADVGGTTMDVGEVQNGFPRPAGTAVSVADVQTNFSMPDVISIGLGGGSIIDREAVTVGPDSVGHRLLEEGVVFGGSVLTASDIAVAAGRTEMGDHPPGDLPDLAGLIGALDQKAGDAIARSRTSGEAMTVIAVGGGAVLLPDKLDGLEVVRPPHYDLANAIGAAIAQVSGEDSRVIALAEGMTREEAIQSVVEAAEAAAVSNGADPDTLQLLSQSDVPLAYLPGSNLAISVTVVGELNMKGA
ncbi:MAG: hydantoinase/oxoprolinase family protein [Pseudomonadota bacterium]|nr:hydantoinase/oxoprolinase family protein [Pseudomonadota bacterium]